MTKEEFSLHYHDNRLEVELSRRTGKSFQDYFEQIMQRADPSFQMVKPMGKAGDWKSDGYSASTSTIYQCYAPEDLTAAKAMKKVREDFNGAKERWKEKMRAWTFVWSSAKHGLPPEVVSLLAELKTENPDLVIDDMGPAGLWRVVKELAIADRETLLGCVPNLDDVPTTTAAEIQVLMKHLGSHDYVTSDTIDFDLTAIAEKLKRNGLSDAVTAMVRPALPVARLVRDYVTSMPDPNFSQAIAADLVEKYTQLVASSDDPDVIFGNLVEYVSGPHRLEPRFFWAAAGVVSHYFELCDIFER